MRILIVNQFFHPDRSATSQLATDLAEGLVDQGHEVSALASRAGYDGGRLAEARSRHRGVRVFRLPATGLGRGGKLARLTDYLSYFTLAAGHVARRRDYDVIITLTTPPLVGLLGLWARGRSTQRSGPRVVHWLMDLYPDVAEALGYIGPRGTPARLLRHCGQAILRGADRLVVLGECMRERVLAHGVDPRRVTVIDNWADGRALRPVLRGLNPLAGAFGLQDRYVVSYSGNLGLAHDTRALVGAMRKMSPERTTWLMIGGGRRMGELRRQVEGEGLPNVRFGPLQPRDRLAQSLSLGDVHLIAMRSAARGLLVPSKLYGIMAVGRPIVFVGPPDCHVARIVRRAGIGRVVAEGNAHGLVEALEDMRTRPGMRELMGERARQYFLDHFDKPHAMAKWTALLDSLDGSRAAPARAA